MSVSVKYTSPKSGTKHALVMVADIFDKLIATFAACLFAESKANAGNGNKIVAPVINHGIRIIAKTLR